jgi:hypothetical protein
MDDMPGRIKAPASARPFAVFTLDDGYKDNRKSVRRLEDELGRSCRHFSYPYGCEVSAGEREFAICREFGFATAVTTRKGLLYASDALDMVVVAAPLAQWRLPRDALRQGAALRPAIRFLKRGSVPQVRSGRSIHWMMTPAGNTQSRPAIT